MPKARCSLQFYKIDTIPRNLDMDNIPFFPNVRKNIRLKIKYRNTISVYIVHKFTWLYIWCISVFLVAQTMQGASERWIYVEWVVQEYENYIIYFQLKSYTEKTSIPFPFTLNGIWSLWQFSFLFWTKWNSIWVKIERNSFPFDYEPNGIPFDSKLKEKLSPLSYPIQFERK